ncbi:MAG: FtsX-like permease family protein [Microscillaceae bacterium]|nr:FtsX-like permease family protein [Microscillaceae bacterium]
MKNSVNRQIAWVHLTSKIRQTFIAVLGVTFGTSMYVFMNSFLGGVNDFQSELAFTTLAHIRVYNDALKTQKNILERYTTPTQAVNLRNEKKLQYTEGIKNTEPLLQLINKQSNVIGVAAQVNSKVFFRSGTKKINGTLSGVDVKQEARLFGIDTKMKAGVWANLQFQNNGIIIGSVMATDLNLKINDNINVLTAEGISRNYLIIGIFETSIKSIDNSKAYLNISTARQLGSFNKSYATDLQINVQDFNDNLATAAYLKAVIPYQVESWQEANEQVSAGDFLRDLIAKAVSLTILLVAGFGIYNIMNMTINSKIKEIAILKAMGFSGGDITEIFLLQAILIGFFGGIVGLLLGFGIATVVDIVPFELAGLANLPMNYEFDDYILAFTFGMIITLFAGYLPARKASQIDPVSIIRG